MGDLEACAVNLDEWDLPWCPISALELELWIKGSDLDIPTFARLSPAVIFGRPPKVMLALPGVGLKRLRLFVQHITSVSHLQVSRFQLLANERCRVSRRGLEGWAWGDGTRRVAEQFLLSIAPDAATPGEAMEIAIGLAKAPDDLVQLVAAVEAGHGAAGVIEEILTVMRIWMKDARFDVDAAIEVMETRMGVRGRKQSTIEAIAEARGVTRQRVDQILARVKEIVPREPRLPITAAWASSFAQRLPATAADMDADMSLSEPLGVDGASPVGVYDFVSDILGIAPNLVTVPAPPVADNAASVLTLEGDDSGHLLLAAVRRAVHSQVNHEGVFHMDVVLGEVSDSLGVPVERRRLERLARGWLGARHLEVGYAREPWMWLGPDRCRTLRQRLLKMLASSPTRLDAADMANGLARSVRAGALSQHARGVALPAHVVVAVCKALPGVAVKQGDDVLLIDRAAYPLAEVLSEGEMRIRDLLLARGNVAAIGEVLREGERAAIALSPMAISLILGKSPIVTRIGYGIYGLRGFAPTAEGYSRALAALTESARRYALGEVTETASARGPSGLFDIVLDDEDGTEPARLRFAIGGHEEARGWADVSTAIGDLLPSVLRISDVAGTQVSLHLRRWEPLPEQVRYRLTDVRELVKQYPYVRGGATLTECANGGYLIAPLAPDRGGLLDGDSESPVGHS